MTKPKSYSALLTETDRHIIQSLMGRKPSELELEFIALVRHEELLNRPYLDTISRLDEGAQRSMDTDKLVRVDDQKAFFVCGGTKILSERGLIIRDWDQALRQSAIHGVVPLAMKVDLNVSPNSEFDRNAQTKFLRRAMTKGKTGGANLIRGQSSITTQIKNGGLYHALAVSVVNPKEWPSTTVFKEGSLIFRLPVGRSWSRPRSDKKILLLIRQLYQRPWFFNAVLVTWRGLGQALIELVQGQSTGISIPMERLSLTAITRTFASNRAKDILIVIQPGFKPELNRVCDALDLTCEFIGTIQNKPNFTITNGEDSVFHIPLTAFDFPWQSTPRDFSVYDQKQVATFDISSIREPKNYTRTLKKIITTTIKEQYSYLLKDGKTVKADINREHGLVARMEGIPGATVLTTADVTHFSQLNPRLGGRLSIANVVRQLVCRGAKPMAVSLRNIFPESTEAPITYDGIEILQGQEEAIRVLGLTIGDRQTLVLDNHCIQQVGAVGVIPPDVKPLTRGFKEVGDFISILGSHRGELGGGEYLRIIHGIIQGVPPSVDLSMEERLNEVILQGIHNRLIKSASNVSCGGLVMAIALSLVSSAQPLGARIHFSRKLRNDELLFGETQGLVVISLGEGDIMEFERICMNIGVPSTTIGRVTDEGKFTFNELINIQTNELMKWFGY